MEKSCEKARVKRVLADKAYDSYENFEFLQSRDIEPSIPVRKGAIDILKHPRSERQGSRKSSIGGRRKRNTG